MERVLVDELMGIGLDHGSGETLCRSELVGMTSAFVGGWVGVWNLPNLAWLLIRVAACRPLFFATSTSEWHTRP